MEKLGQYKIFDRLKDSFVKGNVEGLKKAREERDKRNLKHFKASGEEVPSDPNGWRYCLLNGIHPGSKFDRGFMNELRRL